MALPSDATRDQINEFKRAIGIPEDQLLPDVGPRGPHVTIRFWSKDEGPISEEIYDYLDQRLEGMQITAEPGEMEILGEDTLTILLNSPELVQLQAEIDQKLQEMGVPPSDYPEYKPHVSIAEGVSEVPEASADFTMDFAGWCVTEGSGPGDYEEVWQLRAAGWVRAGRIGGISAFEERTAMDSIAGLESRAAERLSGEEMLGIVQDVLGTDLGTILDKTIADSNQKLSQAVEMAQAIAADPSNASSVNNRLNNAVGYISSAANWVRDLSTNLRTAMRRIQDEEERSRRYGGVDMSMNSIEAFARRAQGKGDQGSFDFSSLTPSMPSYRSISRNFTEMNMGPIRVWISYETPVGFQAPDGRLVVRKNEWGPTTGRHLNHIDGGAKKSRVDKNTFDRLWAEMTAEYLQVKPDPEQLYKMGQKASSVDLAGLEKRLTPVVGVDGLVSRISTESD